MNKVKLFIRTTFLGGFLIVLPIVILLIVLNWMFESVTNFIRPITNLLIQTARINEFVAAFFAMLFIIMVFFLVGLMIKTELGKMTFSAFENKFLGRIFGYKIIKETVLQIFGEEKNVFKAVALVKLFGNQTLMTAFVTDEHTDGSYTVFIPSGPAPTAGFVYHVKAEQITIIDIPVDQALRTILSLGAGSKKIIEKYNASAK